MKKKSILTSVLAGAMAISLLTGCGAGSQTTPTPTATPGGSTATPTPGGEAVSYPLNTDKKLTVWSSIMGPHKSYTDYTQSPYHTGLAEVTGVNVEWQFPTAGSDANQAFNLMLASDTLPDIIIHSFMNDADRYIDEKVIRDLTDALPSKAPSYWALLQSDEHFDTSVKTDSGKYYGFGTFRSEPWNAAYTGPVVRQDWLTEQGLSVPETIADWDNVLRVFNEKYDAKLAFALSRMNPGIAGAFGAYGSFAIYNSILYVDDNGTIQCAMTQPEWKNYMAQLNTWFKDGLVDPDVLTLDDAGMRTKALNNKVGLSFTSMGQMTNWLADASQNQTGAQWVGANYPVVNKGDVVNTIQLEDIVRNYSASITTSCADDKVDVALSWLDYLFTEEGILYSNYGTEGDTYTLVDGVPTFTDKIMKAPEGISEAIDKYTAAQWTNIGVQQANMVRQKNNPTAVAAVDLWIQNQEASKHIVPTGVTRTTEESNEISAILNTVGTYIQEMSLKFMVGEEPLSNFDAYVENLKSIGLDRLLEIQQAAYDRYLAR